MAKHEGLTTTVEDGALVIRLGVTNLAFAFEHGDSNLVFDEKANVYRAHFKVTDEVEFAKDVIHSLQTEEEDGSTPLTDLLDKMCVHAVEDGSTGVEEDNG